MPRVQVNGVRLDYDERGSSSDPAMLMIMGLGVQRISWPDSLLDALADAGFRVVSYDNRDCGLSTVLDDQPVDIADLAGALQGRPFDPPYTLADMAADAIGLLDALGIDRAHVVGASLGGMVAQHLAFDRPERVISLVSMMSTTGSRKVGQASDAAAAVLMTPPPSQREDFIAYFIERLGVIGSPAFDGLDDARDLAGRSFDRGLHVQGTMRQYAALLADRDRTERLARVTAPTLVIHGAIDPLIDVSGGRATAEAIPGAELLVIDGMGHSLPRPLTPRLAEAITSHARSASVSDVGAGET